MNGYEVGEYIQHKDNLEEFIYCESWLAKKAAVPLSLSLPLTDRVHKGDKVTHYFDNLLPGSYDIKSRIQSLLETRSTEPFDLLEKIGKDCVGAIQLRSKKTDFDVKSIESTPISDEEIAKLLRNTKTQPLGMTSNPQFRITIPGTQNKIALLRKDEQWHLPLNETPSTHILKLANKELESGEIDFSDNLENEWLCLRLLRGFGLPAAKANLKNIDGVKVLIVKRFDREYSEDKTWIIRHPQEDMCQASGFSPALKYERDGGPGIRTIMELLKTSIHPEEERRKFMKTMLLLWLMGAIGGHAKNYSLFLKQGGRFELAPLYDVVSEYPMQKAELKKIKMAMALHGSNAHYNHHGILAKHWFQEAKKINFPESEMQSVIDETFGLMNPVIAKISSTLPKNFPKKTAHTIFDGIKKTRSLF